MEMAEERIAERIDSNLMNIPIKDIRNMTKKVFDDRIGKIQQKTQGKLVIKEYPTASAHVGHFRALLDELHMKKNFTPDIIYIDYLNICASSRMHNSSANSYTIIKSIAEEIRGLAVEYDLPVVTATQTTRGGYNNSDVEITDTSESFGLPATADLMVALIAEETDPDHIVVKQLKNRYSDPTSNKRFLIGVDRARMRLYDVTDAQANLHDAGQEQVDDSVPVFDRGRKVGNFAGLNF
jgi:replicative DNA helicase